MSSVLSIFQELGGDGEVYFIAARLGRVKVGYTGGTSEGRARELRTGSPERLRLMGSVPGTMDTESYIHDTFAATRIWSNREWFEPTLKMLVFMVLAGVVPTAAVVVRAVAVSTFMFMTGFWLKPSRH